LWDDFDGSGLWRLARATKDAGQSRRYHALVVTYDGGARSEAARMDTGSPLGEQTSGHDVNGFAR
jgi:hypothetical protein